MSIIAQRSAALEPIVPCLVHKHSADNVWIRQPHPDTGTEARLGYHYPENFEQARLADLIEVQRQAGIFYVHSHLGAPADHVFVLSSISLERLTLSFDQPHEGLADGGSVVVRLHRAPVGTNTRLSFYLFANAGMATGSASVRLLPRRAYERVRRLTASAPISVPATEYVHVFPLAIEPHDPLVSDHESDHVPAMAVIVSIEQALIAFGALRVDALSATFASYINKDEQALCRLNLQPDGAFVGVVEQRGTVRVTFEGRAAAPGEKMRA